MAAFCFTQPRCRNDAQRRLPPVSNFLTVERKAAYDAQMKSADNDDMLVRLLPHSRLV